MKMRFDMSYSQYRQFRSEVHRLYRSGDYTAALERLDQSAEDFPDQAPLILYIRICLLALTHQAPAAIKTLGHSLELGYWYPPATLQGDPDLLILQDMPEFERQVAVCAGRFEEAAKAARPERIVLTPPSGTPAPYPVLLVLHGRNAGAASSQPFWESLAARGWLVALLQSSQVVGVGTYAWEDRQRSIEEARQHFAELSSSYPVHWQRLVLGGFSQGGGLAIWLSLSKLLPAAGFIAVAPYLRGVEELIEAPPATTSRLRGYMVTGDLDEHQEMFPQFERLLNAYQVSYRRETHPDLDHDYPADFDHSLEQALQFILGE
jgi:predicted esterase